jgi:hypothetical protein
LLDYLLAPGKTAPQGNVAQGFIVDIFVLIVILPVTIGALLIVFAKRLTIQYGKSKATRLSAGETRFLWISLAFNVIALLAINIHRFC